MICVGVSFNQLRWSLSTIMCIIPSTRCVYIKCNTYLSVNHPLFHFFKSFKVLQMFAQLYMPDAWRSYLLFLMNFTVNLGRCNSSGLVYIGFSPKRQTLPITWLSDWLDGWLAKYRHRQAFGHVSAWISWPNIRLQRIASPSSSSSS